MRLPIFLVKNTNLRRIMHRFKVIVDYWSNFYFRQGVYIPLYHTP